MTSFHHPAVNFRHRFLRTTPRLWAFSARAPLGTLLFLLGISLASLSCLSSAMGQEASKPTPAAKKASSTEPAWKPMFDGRSLKDWKRTRFGGEGEVVVQNGIIEMGMGSSMTGITYIQKMPKCDYEVQVEAMRVDGIDFFCTTTFPVNDTFCSLVVGGWAGPVVGISCVDNADASENETTTYQKFKDEQWYRIRIQVRKDRIRAWIDDKQVVDLETKGRKLSTRTEVSLSEPFGITCWDTSSAIRKIEIRELPPEAKQK